MTESLVNIGQAGMAEAQRMKARLAERGVTVELAVDPKSCCGGGCSVKAEVWAKAEDLPAIQEFVAAERGRNHAGLEFDPRLLDEVFDPEAAEATCPACATRFATAKGECPECGLCFAVPGAPG